MAEDETLEPLVRRYREALGRRARWQDLWQQCYDYAMPGRAPFNAEEDPGNPRTDHIFDSTAVNAVPEFASNMMMGITPPEFRWMSLKTIREPDEEDEHEVREILGAILEQIFSELRRSNFYSVIPDYYQELSIGTAALLVEEAEYPSAFRFSVVPLTRFCLSSGPHGDVDAFFRTTPMRAGLLPATYPKATWPPEVQRLIESEPERKLTVVDAIERDWTVRETEVYRRTTFLEKPAHTIRVYEYRGEGSCPVIFSRWTTTAGEEYGRGPLTNALADIKTANMVKQLVLENADMAVSGIWTIEDDGVINPDTVRLLPGTMIPKAPGSRGLESVTPAGRFDVSEIILADLQRSIRTALYADPLGPAPDATRKTPMSATEIMHRQNELARRIGAPFARLQHEFMLPLVRRMLHILQRRGIIQIGDNQPVRSILEIVPSAPLSSATDMQDVERFQGFGGLVVSMFGPRIAQVMIDQDAALPWLARKMGIPAELIRSKADQKRLAEAVAQAAQVANQQGMGLDDMAGGNL